MKTIGNRTIRPDPLDMVACQKVLLYVMSNPRSKQQVSECERLYRQMDMELDTTDLEDNYRYDVSALHQALLNGLARIENKKTMNTFKKLDEKMRNTNDS